MESFLQNFSKQFSDIYVRNYIVCNAQIFISKMQFYIMPKLN